MATGKDKSVIIRELKRNGSKRGYSPLQAQVYAEERKERFRREKTFTEVVRELTEKQWSPEQIVSRARRDGIPMVSHERIYQYVRSDKKQGGTLYKHLRHQLKHRKRPAVGKKVIIPDKVSIDSRPDIINRKQRFSDWEIDMIIGPENKGAILTATERQTGFLLMKKLSKGKNATASVEALFYLLLPYKRWIHSITSDNGSEFYEHKRIARQPNTSFFFAHPYSSWERGLNEYTNGLVRQYIPKKQSFEDFNDLDINSFQIKINSRPRKLLDFETPIERFFKKVALVT
jgi:IS30 family transposase